MAQLFYGSSQTDPRFSNYGGKGLIPMSSQTNPWAANYQGAQRSLSGGGQVLGTQAPAQQQQPQQQPQPQPQQQQQGPDPFAESRRIAEETAKRELEGALTEYDRYAEEAGAQRASLGTQRGTRLSELETERGRTEKAHVTAEEEARGETGEAKEKALSTAQDIQKTNRNVLRAMGILSSSAAGEMLTKPMTEFGKQSAELQQGLVKRLTAVEDWWMERQTDFSKATQDVNTQYDELVGGIDRDMRFSGEQRAQAVRDASTALQGRIQEINQQAVAYQQAARQYSDNVLMQIAQMKMYQDPQADMSGIFNTLLSGQSGGQRQQTGIYQGETDEEKRRRGLLSNV